MNSFKGFFKEEEPNLEEITSEEIQELINACTNDRDRLLIAMMAETGLRLGEILGIHYTEDIDFERRNPHQLRHYFAEERRKEGWDLNDIRFALGHKKVETTIKYLGENNERLIEATDQYYSNNEDLYQIADFL